METYEEDDDTHFCIKCHSTINGLDNYVRHRQSGCRASEAKPSEVTHEPPSTPTTVTYPEILNADAFFSSLELQSSAKSNSTLRSQSLTDRGRKAGRSEDRNKKKARRGQEPDDGALKEKLLNMPPVVADLDDLMDHLGIPSLVGFPDIVTTSGGKTSAGTSSGKLASSSKLSNRENLSESPVDGIMRSSKLCSERKRNDDGHRVDQDNGEWLDDTLLVDLDANSENKDGDHSELTSYTDYDYQQDEDTNEESPEDDIDDDDSFTNDDEADDREYVPRGHTGGKWKPSELLQDMSRLNEEFVADEDNNEHPSSLHTGGKWKPADNSQAQRVDENVIVDKGPGASSLGTSATTGQQPSAGHTRGKWIPGAPGDFSSGYWCDPCGRKLASRLLYNRHLLSDLHARRSIQEIDGDLQLPSCAGPLVRRKPASKRQRALAEIKSKTKAPSQDDNKGTRKKTRSRQKEVLICEMCRARVRRPQMGKHLLSHYHCRVAGANPCSNPAARRFILENMGNVVRQCPFQCAICRFYCNTEKTFLLHWRSTLHTSKFDNIAGSYKCTPCDFYCEENETMERHLVSSGHRELVVLINGSVPVVIGRQRSLVCETCNQHFRYNLQLIFHVRETGHCGSITATDEYQNKMACGLCSQVVRSLVALQRHQLSCHTREEDVRADEAKVVAQASAPYFCSFCTMNFTTARDAVLHRRTSSHKEIVKAQKLTIENTGPPTRECPHCGSKHGSIVEHKKHLLQQHPELCHRCPRCGILLALPQDVTRHTRDVKCTKPIGESVDKIASHSGEWRCNNCPFTTDSRAEFLFHDALHAGSIEDNTTEAGSSKSSSKYRCPMCEKSFGKVTLRNHLRSHTGERPFRCVKCSKSFARRSSLNVHRKECTLTPSSTRSSKKAKDKSPRRRNHTCSECDTAFYTNRIVSRVVTYHETYVIYDGLFIQIVGTRIANRHVNVVEWDIKNECCSGFIQQGTTPLKCNPVCRSGCSHGKCIEPNVCICDAGHRVTKIDRLSTCVPDCNGKDDDPEGCGSHARCIAPRQCQCDPGYEMTIKKLHLADKPTYVLPCVPKCTPECEKNAYCSAPNKCQCNAGYRSVWPTRQGDKECLPICDKKCLNGVCISPNKCGCLPGYQQHPTKNFECQPICENKCLYGDCTRPNHCECHRGYRKDAMDLPHSCSPICDPKCINANCIKPNNCECHSGYNKSSSNACFPICDPPCINTTCVHPNHCECFDGFEKDTKDSPQVCSPVCDPLCINADCTHPYHCECHLGYEKDLNVSSEVCLPICDPPCINATCAHPNHCECFVGFGKDTKDLPQVCSPVCDPPCINADCTQPSHCDCYAGYEKGLKVSSEICLPICDPPCIGATCTQPNHCECDEGYKKYMNSPLEPCFPFCDPPCINATCAHRNHCECFDGFGKDTKDPPQVCSPVCVPPCINADCTQPSHCDCYAGYEKDLKVSSEICLPICDPPCIGATCTQPHHCECDEGYKKYINGPLEPCFPFCDPPCVNATCAHPNHCKCFDGFGKDTKDPPHVCSPVCDPLCINADSTQPNHCECDPRDELDLKVSPEVSLPICDLPCIGATCTQPNYCECDEGYKKYINDPLEPCLPFCDPPCINATCTHPNHCESSFFVNNADNCTNTGNFLNENGTCVCKYGWTGWRCDEPFLCLITFAADNATNEPISILKRIAALNKWTSKAEYDQSDESNVAALEWQGPSCNEQCRVSVFSLANSGIISDKITYCHRLEMLNTTNDFNITDDLPYNPEGENMTVVCFFEIESECNSLEPKMSEYRGPIEYVVGQDSIVGTIILFTLIVSLGLGTYIICLKRRNTNFVGGLSKSNDTMLEWL